MANPNPFGGPSEAKPSAGIVEYSGDVDAWRKRYLAHEALNKDDTGILWNGRVASIYPQAFLNTPRYNPLQGLSDLRKSEKAMEKAIDEIKDADIDSSLDDVAKKRLRERLKTLCAQNKSGLDNANLAVDSAQQSLQDTMNGLKPGTSKWGPKAMAYFGAQRMEEEVFRTARGQLAARHAEEKREFEALLAGKIYADDAAYAKADADGLIDSTWEKVIDSSEKGQVTSRIPEAEANELRKFFVAMQENEVSNYDTAESKARTTFQDNTEYNKDWAIICAMQSTESFNKAKENQKRRCQAIIDEYKAKFSGTTLEISVDNMPDEVKKAQDDIASDALPDVEDFDELQVTLDNRVQGSCTFVMKISKDSEGGLHLAFTHDTTKGSIENRKDVYEAVDRIILTVLCGQRQKGIPVADAKIKLDGGSDEMIRVLAAAAIARGVRPENITLTKNGQKVDMPEDIKQRAQRVHREALVNTGTVDEVSNRMDYAVKSPMLTPALENAETAEEVDELQAKHTMEYVRVNEALKAIANANMDDDQAFSEAVLQLNKLAFDPSHTRWKDNWGRRAAATMLTGGVAYGLGKAASKLGVLNTNPFALQTPSKDAKRDATYKPLTAITLSMQEKRAIQEVAKKSLAQLQTKDPAKLEEQFEAKKTALSSSASKTI